MRARRREWYVFRACRAGRRIISTMEKVNPGSGRESVWDYPRPPRVELCERRLRVEFDGETLAETVRAYRVLETSHPPTYYIPQADVKMALLRPNTARSCGGRFGDCIWRRSR